jgi:hypothetical protein
MESIIIRPQIQIVYINRNNPSKNYHNVSAACLGRYDLSHIYRILIKFPITAIPEDAIIIEASFKMYVTAVGAGQPNEVTCYVITEPWAVDTVTWSNQPLFSSELSSGSININKAGQYTFDITEIVKKWYNHELINYGLILKNDEIKDATFAKVLIDSGKTFMPMVEVKYVMKCKCECECKAVPTEFVEAVEEIRVGDMYAYSSTMNTSLMKTITYFIKNAGPHPVTAKLQISPNRADFIDDNGNVIIEPGGMTAIVPYCFAKFTRMAVRNVDTSEASIVKIWYQAQK